MNTILSFEGNITTVTPFTVQLPNKNNVFPHSMEGLPIIQSSTIRGWLRHSVHNAIAAMANHQGQSFDVAEHHFMGLGLDVHNQLSKVSQMERKKINRNLKEQNPFFAVFGRWLSGGRLVVNNAVANKKDAVIQIGSSSSTNILKSDPHVLQQIDPSTISELDSILLAKVASADIKSDTKNEIKALQAKLNKPDIDPNLEKLIQKSIKSLETKMSELEKAERGVGPHRKVNNTVALAENVVLKHSMRLNNPSEKDFIFFVWSIFTASKHPIGGKVGQGYGQIEFEWDIYSETLFDVTRKHIGVIGFNQKEGFYLKANDDIEKLQKLLKKENFNIETISKIIAEKCTSYGKFR
ncbi:MULTISPECIES: RAMP superfamily CRISPR-associated protein [Acinetobacter]|uniref:Uncharacterized protein n=1 Tax=Acinetobacter indicus TaxID=756892 RepID=A0A6C0Y6E4_9GAMM|nr:MULTISPECIES: RAMP superfamily CRISPR-associated protein [Acinetobacter]QIC71709.1 hypothetical protein FSC09_15040 [Acinetobacter indicus]QKQ71618.1 hypothetical protein E5Y90_15405 [Acinetobacter sp. 10FS3-1]